MTRFPRSACVCSVPLDTLSPEALRLAQLTTPARRTLTPTQCAARAALVFCGLVVWFVLFAYAATVPLGIGP